MGTEGLKFLWASIGMTIAYICGVLGLIFAGLYYKRRRAEAQREREEER